MLPVRSDLGSVVLTTGGRPRELAVAIESLTVGLGCDVLVVWNSSTQVSSHHGEQPNVKLVWPGSNLGIPGGRSFGAQQLSCDYVVFLDDDAELLNTDAGSAVVVYFAEHPRCAVIAFGIIDDSGSRSRRHNPRVGTRGATLPGPVGTFLGGACAIRRSAFEQVGGYDDSFYYAMEEQDLSWRLWDAGWEVHYRPEIVVKHPRTHPLRHENALIRTWQNRVTAARRSLPLPIRVVHLALHGARAVKMGLSPRNVLGVLVRHPWPTDSKPMSWRTVAQLTRIGRPPIF